jgi:hypothetical protein
LPPDVVQVVALAERADDSQRLPPPAEGGGTVHDHQMVHGCEGFGGHESMVTKRAIKIICGGERSVKKRVSWKLAWRRDHSRVSTECHLIREAGTLLALSSSRGE